MSGLRVRLGGGQSESFHMYKCDLNSNSTILRDTTTFWEPSLGEHNIASRPICIHPLANRIIVYKRESFGKLVPGLTFSENTASTLPLNVRRRDGRVLLTLCSSRTFKSISTSLSRLPLSCNIVIVEAFRFSSAFGLTNVSLNRKGYIAACWFGVHFTSKNAFVKKNKDKTYL